jgi:peptide/nickel transport system ATP-binding protein
LLRCIPVPGSVRRDAPLGSIPGVVPRIAPHFVGCAFRDRCPHANADCARNVPKQHAGIDHEYLCRLTPDWTRAEAA